MEAAYIASSRSAKNNLAAGKANTFAEGEDFNCCRQLFSCSKARTIGGDERYFASFLDERLCYLELWFLPDTHYVCAFLFTKLTLPFVFILLMP